MFLISTIGPNTRKATIDPVANVLLNEEAIKASASEHRDRTKARPIMTSDDEMSFCPIASRVDVFINVHNSTNEI